MSETGNLLSQFLMLTSLVKITVLYDPQIDYFKRNLRETPGESLDWGIRF